MKMKAAILQTKVFAEKEKNIRQLEEILASGKTGDADLVTLPEMFACPYETGNFPLYAEPEGGPSWQALSALAKKYHIYLSAGSMPELEFVTAGENAAEKAAELAATEEKTAEKAAELAATEEKTAEKAAELAATEEKTAEKAAELAAAEEKAAKQAAVFAAAGKKEQPCRRVYNTAYVFDREGRQIGKHRKAHLFDINVTGGQCFRESDTLSPGNQITCFDTEFGKIGLCICYDFRFPETARLMAQDGAKLILVPAAFNMTTGPAHWELMFRQRAVESQCYVIGTAPARDMDSSYISWGHSIAVDPWGTILTQMDEKEGIRLVEFDFDYLEKVRQELPLLKHRRTDLYELHRI